MIFMLDNYDSFTYNLVQYFEQLGCELEIARNDEIAVDAVLAMRPEAIVLSPGPSRPENAGIMLELIKAAAPLVPLFGVCLGHQAIGQAFGGKVVSAKRIMHGKLSEVTHDGKGIFAGIASPLKAVRYHSLAVEESSLPDCLEVSARAEDGEIMAMRHRTLPIESVQYHPESILSASGKRQLANFLKIAQSARGGRRYA
ncbi:MAG: aminodeoxychorismate/anthranilate synthase component II [Victivallaceae bacterium]|nr:aminodeoxychorismate/anthranilate synthase component II [Victivallaceae bacterium]